MITAQLPDGTKLQFPDDTSQDVIQGVVHKQLGIKPTNQKPIPLDPNTKSVPRTALEQGLQGLTFGFGDEAADALGAGATKAYNMATGNDNSSLGQLYDEARANTKQRLPEQFKQNPITSILSQLAGGAVTGGAGLSALKTAAPAAATALETYAQANPYKTALGVGATSGALYGAGAGEGGIKERIPDALSGGMVGAGTGALGAYIGRNALAPIVDRISQSAPMKSALSRISGAFEESPQTNLQTMPSAQQSFSPALARQSDDIFTKTAGQRLQDPNLQRLENDARAGTLTTDAEKAIRQADIQQNREFTDYMNKLANGLDKGADANVLVEGVTDVIKGNAKAAKVGVNNAYDLARTLSKGDSSIKLKNITGNDFISLKDDDYNSFSKLQKKIADEFDAKETSIGEAYDLFAKRVDGDGFRSRYYKTPNNTTLRISNHANPLIGSQENIQIEIHDKGNAVIKAFNNKDKKPIYEKELHLEDSEGSDKNYPEMIGFGNNKDAYKKAIVDSIEQAASLFAPKKESIKIGSPEIRQGLWKNLAEIRRNNAYDLSQMPKVKSVIKRLATYSKQDADSPISAVKLGELENWRKQATNAANSTQDSTERKFLGEMVRGYDSFMEKTAENAVDIGDSEAIRAFRDAVKQRRNYGQLFESNKLVGDIIGGNKSVDDTVKSLIGTGSIKGKKEMANNLDAILKASGKDAENVQEDLKKAFTLNTFKRSISGFEPNNPNMERISPAKFKTELENIFVHQNDFAEKLYGKEVVEEAKKAIKELSLISNSQSGVRNPSGSGEWLGRFLKAPGINRIPGMGLVGKAVEAQKGHQGGAKVTEGLSEFFKEEMKPKTSFWATVAPISGNATIQANKEGE